MNANTITRILEPKRTRWPFQRRTAAWLTSISLCLLGFLLPARGQDIPNPYYPSNATVSLGATVSFRAVASTANPPLTFQWQHDATDLSDATNNILWLTNVTMADAGGYRAMITNAIGAFTNTRTATLTVDPTFIKMDIDKGPNDMWIPYWVDLDRDPDGLLELVVAGGWGTAGGKPLMVFKNNRDGTLRRDLTNDLAKVSIRGGSIAWADLDNDGDLDGFAGAFESERPIFLRNDGGGRFTKIVADRWWTANGIAPYGAGATSADLDDDGTLDLLVGYFGGLATGVYGTNAVLHGLGSGRFEVDLTSPLALSDTWVENYDWADWDGDGKLDLFGATSGGAPPVDLMFQNLGSGQFQQVTDNLLVQIQDVSIDSAWGDYDNDGDLDVLVTSFNRENQLYLNRGGGVFEPDPSSPVFPAGQIREVAVWGDYDNDGWLDLYVAHGDRAGRLFHNRGNGTFEEVTTGSPVSECRAYGCAWGDYDNDGFLDLCATRDVDGSNYLYHNNLRQVGNTNHWLKVKLVGTASNRDGIGATIRIKTTVAGKGLWQMRQIVCQSHGAELIAHFGLGDANVVDLIRIEWPSGSVQEVEGVRPDRLLPLTEPIRINPLRPTASLGASVTLTNVSGGTSFQWLFNGTNLVGQTGRTLTLNNLAAADAGRYSVVVKLSNGSTQTNYTYLAVNSTFTKITKDPVVADRLDTVGGSWVDIDQDGYIDLVVWNGAAVGEVQTNGVFRNNRVGGFERLTLAQAGDIVGIVGKWWGGAWGDLDGDGDVDCFAGRDPGPMKCFLNDGLGFFTDWISSDQFVTDPGGGFSSFGDYDNDGWLDVFVGSAWADGKIYTNRLYHGIGGGRFEAVTTGPIVTNRVMYTEAQAWSDYDGDGDLDLIVTSPESWWNDHNAFPVYLYRNDGGGQFTRITKGVIPEAKGGLLVPAWADYDNDGKLDLFLSDYDGPSKLFHNEGNGEFTSQTVQTGPASGYSAWGDFDNDGDLDLVLATGQANDQTNLFFLNEGGQLVRTSMGSLTSELGKTGPIIWGDYDNDGFLDLFVGRVYNQVDSLFHNNGNSNHWVMVNLKGTTSNPSAIGAKVRVQAMIRGKSVWQLREISGGNRFQGDPRAHFGLGNATNAVTVRIEWPSATVQELKNVAADHILEVVEPRRPMLAVAVTPTLVTGTLTGDTNQVYQVQMSDDLAVGWTVLTNVTTDASGNGNWSDAGVAPQGRRFYQAVKTP